MINVTRYLLAHLATRLDSFTDEQRYENPRQQQAETELPPDVTDVSNISVTVFTHHCQPAEQAVLLLKNIASENKISNIKILHTITAL